jgi:iron/zinc/copper transport system substrate-binding protein
MKKLLATFLVLAASVAGLFYFLDHRTQTATTTSAGKLRVVTTNSILEDMVEQVGGKHVEVYSIVSRGVDPHEYEPQPADITATHKADVLFHNGLNLETGGNGWFKKLVANANKQFDEDVFAASDGVNAKHLTTNVEEVDPHAWLDLANGIQYVETIAKVLSQKDPDHAKAYQQNADAYTTKLRQLHQQAQSKFTSIPENQRVLVTSEGAFKYFAAAYHVTPTYIWEINTESQGTPAQMQAVINKIKQTKVKHLFVETSVSPKSMNKLASETGLKIYSKLYTDSLGQKGSNGDTYYKMMQWNLDQIAQGLS